MRALTSALTLLLAACGGPTRAVHARAMTDLDCSDVVVAPMPGHAYYASGCGRTVSYVCLSGLWGPHCTREGEVVTAGASTETPPSTDDVEADATLHAHPPLLAVARDVRACSPVARTLRLDVAADGRIRGMNGNIATADEEECISRVLSGVRLTSVTQPTQLSVRFSTDPPRALDSPPASPAAPALEPWLADIATRQRDAILACTGRPLVAVRVVVTNQVPQWSLQGELAGSAEEACVRSLVAGEPYPPADGTLVRVIR